MRKALPLAIAAGALALGGCGAFKHRGAGLDEFAVARNAPLVIPPDFALTPPVAGTAGISASDAQNQTIDVLFGGPAQRSATEAIILDSAGRDRATMGARSVAGDPDTRVVDKGAATPAIIAAPAANSRDASASTPQGTTPPPTTTPPPSTPQ